MIRSNTRLFVKQLRQASWLYFFLALFTIAPFASLLNAADTAVGIKLAVAMASYGILIFIIVTVIRTEELLRAILVIMAAMSVLIIAYTFVQYFVRQGAFIPGQQDFVLGISNAHYLAYALIMNSAGIAFLFFQGDHSWFMKLLIIASVIGWFQLTSMHGSKIGHIATAFLLVLFMATVHKRKRKAIFLLILFLSLFYVRMHNVSVKRRTDVIWKTIDQYQEAASQYVDAKKARIFAYLPLPRKEEFFRIPAPEPPPPPAPEPPPPPAPEPPPPPAPEPPPPPAPEPPPQEEEWGQTDERVTRIAGLLSQVAGEVDSEEYYSDQNFAARRWAPNLLSDSLKMRQRGLAVGWLTGHSYPWFGMGVGQTTPEQYDFFSEKVREMARDGDMNVFEQFLFTTEKINPARPDKGVFNIFGIFWAEMGFLGFFGLVGMLVVIIAKSIRAIWVLRRSTRLFTISVLFPVFLALLLYHQTSYLIVLPWFWTVLALTYSAADVAIKENAV